MGFHIPLPVLSFSCILYINAYRKAGTSFIASNIFKLTLLSVCLLVADQPTGRPTDWCTKRIKMFSLLKRRSCGMNHMTVTKEFYKEQYNRGERFYSRNQTLVPPNPALTFMLLYFSCIFLSDSSSSFSSDSYLSLTRLQTQ